MLPSWLKHATNKRLADAALRSLGGWRFVGDAPKPRRAVCLAVPHTSNLDGLLLVLLARSAQMDISWMIKDAWTKPPLGVVVKGVGAVPVDRSKANGMVGQMIDEFARRDDFHLVIPPEGTRARADCWKSGFYRIAVGAKVPIVPGFLDYSTKQGGFGEPFDPTGDVAKDMDRLREFYEDGPKMARFPENFGPVRLREEM